MPTIVVLLLFVGFFKGASLFTAIPVDLTVACIALVGACVGGHLIISGGRARVTPWALLLVGLLLPAALFPVTNPAALDKRLKLVIPLLAVVGVCYLVRSLSRQRVWLWLHVAVGAALVATGIRAGDDVASRFSGASSNPIGAGRASGVAIVVLLLLLIGGGMANWWKKAFAILTVVWLATALISTGSRGPAFACAAAILIVASVGRGRHRLLKLLSAMSAVAAGWLLLSDATGIGATRITKSLTGEYSLTQSRNGLWMEALQSIPSYPFGIGWGNFWAILPPSERLASGYVQHPHNVILEVFVEGGWLAGLGIVAFLVASLVRLHRASYCPEGAALFGVAIFFVLNALVSGDVNDNRMMWAAVAIAWVRDPEGAARVEEQSVSLREQTPSGTQLPVRL